MHAAHRLRRPSRLRGSEVRVCGTAGSSSNSPQKPPTDAAPPPSFQEALSPKHVAQDAPRSEGVLEGARLGWGRLHTQAHPNLLSVGAWREQLLAPRLPPWARARSRALATRPTAARERVAARRPVPLPARVLLCPPPPSRYRNRGHLETNQSHETIQRKAGARGWRKNRVELREAFPPPVCPWLWDWMNYLC